MKVSRHCVVPPTLKIATAYRFQMISTLLEFTGSRDGYIGCLVTQATEEHFLMAGKVESLMVIIDIQVLRQRIQETSAGFILLICV